jgi:uncharacterized membrane protein YidH (DUF202 family)
MWRPRSDMTSRPRWENRTVNEGSSARAGIAAVPEPGGTSVTPPSPGGPAVSPGPGSADDQGTDPHRDTNEAVCADPARRTYPAQERTVLAGWRTAPGTLAVAVAIGSILPKLAQLPKGPSVGLGVEYAVLSIWFILLGAARVSHRRPQHTNNSRPNHLHNKQRPGQLRAPPACRRARTAGSAREHWTAARGSLPLRRILHALPPGFHCGLPRPQPDTSSGVGGPGQRVPCRCG